MSIQIVIGHGRDEPRDVWTDPYDARGALDYLRAALKREGPPFEIKLRGQDWGPDRPLPGTMDRLQQLWTSEQEVGQVRSLATGRAYAFRTFEPTIPDVSVGNEHVDAITHDVKDQYPDVASYGWCNRRHIDGSTSWTQHCPWPVDPSWHEHFFSEQDRSEGSNAWDIGGVFGLLADVADHLYDRARHWWTSDGADGLPSGRIIFNRRIWDPVQGWHAYTGSDPHTGHIHAEGAFTRTGTPRASCP